jgi:hypothetical protein
VKQGLHASGVKQGFHASGQAKNSEPKRQEQGMLRMLAKTVQAPATESRALQ